MKKFFLTLAVMLACVTMTEGQTYTTLWKQVKEAEQKDLPRTQYDVLMKIARKAQKEHQPGQLMKAELQGARVMTEISPDSLLPAVERMEARMETESDQVLKTVYQVVLRRIFKENSELDRKPQEIVLVPELCGQLAAVKAVDYEPLTVKGIDSRMFDDDLLSVIGYELEQYQPLYDYYSAKGNRKASFLTALELLRLQRPEGRAVLKKSDYLHRVDSLISVYGDLTVCGEAAIERYRYMERYTDATAEEKWQYINLALDRWGAWKGMNELRNSQRSLTAPMVMANLNQENVGIPDRELKFHLPQLRNIRQLTMHVYSVKAQGDTDLNPNTTEGYRKLKTLLTLLPYDVSRQYVGKAEYEVFEDSLTLPGLPEGVYLIEVETQPATQPTRQLYYVSNVRVLMEALPEDKIRYVVVNATTGQPLKGAHVKLTNNKKTLKTLTTDQQGEAVWQIGDTRPQWVFAYTDADTFCKPVNRYSSFSFYNNQRHREQADIYTDRAIYRPGQTVHVAAIVYATDNGYDHKTIEGKTLKLALRDANYNLVSEKEVTTDRFGTCSADFTLPTGLLNGRFSLQALQNTCTFRVEDYKRPTFEVKFPEVNQVYEEGDTVQVRATARSYAGVPVQNAEVRYTVRRRRAWWWTMYSSYWNQGYIGTSSDDEEVAEGETVTDGDGSFTVDMPMVLPPSTYPQFYNFVCTAYVTDQAGETHQAELSLPLGNRKTAFYVDMANQILAEDAPKVTFHQMNAAGIDINTTLRYRLDNGKWNEAKTNTPLELFNARTKSGAHTLEAICEQDTLKCNFTVFSLDDKRPAAKTDDWLYVSSYVFPNDGKPVTVQVGSSAPDVHIVYTMIAGKRVLESGSVDKSNELINRKLTYKEDYGDVLLLTYAWVKEGKVYTHSVSIERPRPDRRLKLEWETFRDRLTPGQKEEWRLTVKAPSASGEWVPAEAQLMATLYDKSLEQLQPHRWNMWPYATYSRPNTQWRYGSWNMFSLYAHKAPSMLVVQSLNLTHLDGSIFPSMMRQQINYRAMRLRSVGAGLPKAAGAVYEESVYELKEVAVQSASRSETTGLDTADETVQGRIAGLDIISDKAEESDQIQVRENLQETAFFYPQLVADKNGGVTLSFTLPESLTTWRFMGLAHTVDLCNGKLEDEAVAQKDVMIQPNVPRFVREGDQATVSARIFNLSGKTVSGMSRLQLVDPETDKVVSETSQPFSLATDSSAAVTFQLPSLTTSLLICRVTASGQGFSDGEQHYLPVLPAKERVTVTVPFTQNGPGTKTIDLTQLFPANPQQPSPNTSKLTIEYTNNPAWLMIQALPAVGHPHDDCAACQVASLYANSIGKYIVDQVPQAKKVFEQWKLEETAAGEAMAETGAKLTSLNSQLQKNQELKDVLLSETPWVLDADREQEQRQRLADFFDENLMTQRLSSATDKLQALQRSDGSWSWWPDMPGSTYMTMAISHVLVRLQTMTGSKQPMLDGAFKFLGREMVELVKEMKKQEKKGRRQTFPSHTALQWLYICKLDGRQLSSSVQQANDYLINLLKKETKNQGIYEKAMSSIILDSPLYIKSLKEYTVYKEEMGRYYDTPRAGYSWRDYRIPTQVAAIEAIQRLTPNDTQTLAEMRRWLLQQKRTQAWDTPLNSVDAVYAFLCEKGEVKSGELVSAVPTTLSLDGKPLETLKTTAGIGYVKTAKSYQGEKTFTAEKTSDGTSWGAVYAQFMQATSDIKDNGSGVTIKRELLGSDLLPLTSHLSPLKIGTRVTVRLTIQSERDLDFVQVQDKRAACLEPVKQLSGYNWQGGYYCSPRDNTTNFFFDRLPKGKHVIETEYYIDRAGQYETGTCTVQCAYAPEFRGHTHSQTIKVE